MLQVLWEVLKDLWSFVFHRKRDEAGYVGTATTSTEKKYEPVFSPNIERKVLSEDDKKYTPTQEHEAFVLSEKSIIFSEPSLLFDTKVWELSYGDKLCVLRFHGSFAQICFGHTNGWVKADSLTQDPTLVLPEFRPTYVYDANNDQTAKLREYIKDVALGGELKIPLQTTEFILYTLASLRVNIPWPEKRPRTPGSWKSILRGVPGIIMTLEPKTGSILEYAGDDGVNGFLAYVVAVHPDLSITIKSIGRLKEGEYREEDFTQSQWKEWRPVFISFS